MGSISLKIDDGTIRFHRAIILSEIEAPLPSHARLASPLPPWALSPLRSVTAPPVSAAPSSSARSRPSSVVSTRSSAISLDTKPSTPPSPGLPQELKLVLARHPLPLGRDSRFSITTMVSSVAHSCARPAVVALLSTSCPTVTPPLAPPPTPSFSLSSSPRPAMGFMALGFQSSKEIGEGGGRRRRRRRGRGFMACGPCQAGTCVPCRVWHSWTGMVQARAIPGLVRVLNFSSSAWYDLIYRAWYDMVL